MNGNETHSDTDEGEGTERTDACPKSRTEIRKSRIERRKSQSTQCRATKVAKGIVEHAFVLLNKQFFYSADAKVVRRPNEKFSLLIYLQLYAEVVK